MVSLVYFVKVIPVMQRLATVKAAAPDETCTFIWSMFSTSAAVILVPDGTVL